MTTSPDDVVLADLAPAFGTADRQYVGRNIVGLKGFDLAPNATPQTRRWYHPVVYLARDPSLDRYGDYGRHTDTTKPEFVQHVIAPQLMQKGPRYVRVHAAGSGGTFQNTRGP